MELTSLKLQSFVATEHAQLCCSTLYLTQQMFAEHAVRAIGAAALGNGSGRHAPHKNTHGACVRPILRSHTYASPPILSGHSPTAQEPNQPYDNHHYLKIEPMAFLPTQRGHASG